MFSIQRTLAVLLVGLLPVAVANAQPSADERTTTDIRQALERLPHYGVFDLLTFTYESGSVTLSGFAYAPGLERDAVRVVKRVPRVDTVVNRIETLSLSLNDERIRWSTFYNIYSDSFLSRYAPGGGFSRFDRQFSMARFPGVQPFGTYPIHIVVDRGKTLLAGSVDLESDKTVAGIRAREVTGTFSVENGLAISAREMR